MKKLLLFSVATVFIIGEAAAQATPTVTVTNATNCSPPCNGSAITNDVSAFGGTYLWSDPQAQTTMTATGLCPGTYSVTVTIPLVGSATGTGTVTCSSGILEYALSNQIEIFPNPATKDISIALFSPKGGMVSEVSVFNIAGEKVI